MSKQRKSIRYKGLTRISATFTKSELNDLKYVAQLEGCSQTAMVNIAVAAILSEYGKKEMYDRVALLALSPSRKGIGGGNKRKPIKKVTQRKRGVKVVVGGDKSLIGQIEMDLKK